MAGTANPSVTPGLKMKHKNESPPLSEAFDRHYLLESSPNPHIHMISKETHAQRDEGACPMSPGSYNAELHWTKPSSYYIPSVKKDTSLGVGAGQEAQRLQDRVGTGTLWRKGKSTEKVER